MMVPRVQLTVRTTMVAVAIAAVCLAIPLWGKTAYRNYQIARQLRYPVAVDLWRGRIAAGDRIERVTARNQPRPGPGGTGSDLRRAAPDGRRRRRSHPT